MTSCLSRIGRPSRAWEHKRPRQGLVQRSVDGQKCAQARKKRSKEKKSRQEKMEDERMKRELEEGGEGGSQEK